MRRMSGISPQRRSGEAEKRRSGEFCRSREDLSSTLLQDFCRQAAAPTRKAEECCIMRSLIAFSIGHIIKIDKRNIRFCTEIKFCLKAVTTHEDS